ncbi:MAG: acylphosphatase [Nitrososphaerales archaeon]|nr:acylphosphatase [Nitrososphaerales archaeon]
MIRAEIIVKGIVQKVGYRDYVQDVARRLGVKGYVENLRDGNVRIVCEAEEMVLKDFIERVNIKKDLIVVESVEVVKREIATGEYQYFDIKYGRVEEEIGERLVAAFNIAVATRQDIRLMHQDLKETIQFTHEDLKGTIKDMHEDLKATIAHMHEDLRGAITNMHEDLKGTIKDMHGDLKGTTKDMHKDLKGAIVSMHQDMNSHFKDMADRYDVISKELVRTRRELLRTRRELKRSVDNLEKVVKKFLEKP